jgi:hypothetical protein
MAIDAVLAVALEELSGARHRREDAVEIAPRRPGYTRSMVTIVRGQNLR